MIWSILWNLAMHFLVAEPTQPNHECQEDEKIRFVKDVIMIMVLVTLELI